MFFTVKILKGAGYKALRAVRKSTELTLFKKIKVSKAKCWLR
jgi:hypothetical protein